MQKTSRPYPQTCSVGYTLQKHLPALENAFCDQHPKFSFLISRTYKQQIKSGTMLLGWFNMYVAWWAKHWWRSMFIAFVVLDYIALMRGVVMTYVMVLYCWWDAWLMLIGMTFVWILCGLMMDAGWWYAFGALNIYNVLPGLSMLICWTFNAGKTILVLIWWWSWCLFDADLMPFNYMLVMLVFMWFDDGLMMDVGWWSAVGFGNLILVCWLEDVDVLDFWCKMTARYDRK